MPIAAKPCACAISLISRKIARTARVPMGKPARVRAGKGREIVQDDPISLDGDCGQYTDRSKVRLKRPLEVLAVLEHW